MASVRLQRSAALGFTLQAFGVDSSATDVQRSCNTRTKLYCCILRKCALTCATATCRNCGVQSEACRCMQSTYALTSVTAQAYQKVALPKLEQCSCHVCLLFAQDASILSQQVLQVLLQTYIGKKQLCIRTGLPGDCESAFSSSSSLQHSCQWL
jgi:hypothetical protein